MVIIKEDNIPPLCWPLGLIINTFSGPDNYVSVAEIKTAYGIVKRAIHKLAPLFPEEKVPTLPKLKSKKEDNDDQAPIKRTRLTSNNMLVTILAVIFCLPLVLGNTIEITKLLNKPGIHFENIGKHHIITIHWNILIYYDLEPLRTEIEALTKGTTILQQMCRQLQHEACDDLVSQFTHVKNELESDCRLFLQKRTKKGAINVIGNVASTLFGVLDSEYAKEMSKTIQRIDNDENHIVELVKNQTSIIDSTVNIIKIDQQAVKRKFDAFDKSLNAIKNQIQTTVEDQRLSQTMFSVALHLIMTTANLRRIQSIMVNVLSDVHHGQIGPMLLSLEQLKEEIIKIKGHLPPSTQLPVQQEDILSLYKLMTVEAGLTHDHILFKIKLPLIEVHEFNMYRVIPIPTSTNGSLYALKSTTDISAVTAHGDKYYPLSQQQYNDCLKVGKQTILCSYTQSIYNKGATANSCEVNLFNNETKLSCEVVRVPHSQWIQMNNKNQWIFSLKQPTKVAAVCEKDVHQVLLEGAGILKMNPECTIKNELFTLIGHKTFNSVVRASVTTYGYWLYLENPKTAEPVLLENAIEPYNIELNELIALQKMLKEQHIDQFQNKLKDTSQHFLGIGYTALILAIIICIYLLARNRRRRRGKPFHKEDTPAPAPRNYFTVHV